MADTPPPHQIIFQQPASPPPGAQCSSHAMFERFLQQSMESLGDRLAQLAEALTSQSKSNGEAIAKVLANQADRRELCGQQNARLDNLESSDKDQWKAIDDLRKYVWIGVGIMVAAQVALKFIFKGV